MLPWWLSWQRICLQFRRPGFDPWVGKIPWRRERLPAPVFWPGEFHGLDSPWGRKESDLTEQLSTAQQKIHKNGYDMRYIQVMPSWWRILLHCGSPGFDPWVGKVPWRRERLPAPVFWPGEFNRLYSSWGRKESDTTQPLSHKHPQ